MSQAVGHGTTFLSRPIQVARFAREHLPINM
jgi:hypothetical protein